MYPTLSHKGYRPGRRDDIRVDSPSVCAIVYHLGTLQYASKDLAVDQNYGVLGVAASDPGGTGYPRHSPQAEGERIFRNSGLRRIMKGVNQAYTNI